MAVLITGGGGFLGRHLSQALATRGDDVVIGDVARVAISDDLRSRVRYVPCDVTSASSFFGAVHGQQIDGIIHLAVAIRTTAELDPVAAYRVNIDGVQNVLEVARICGVGRLVFISSHSVFPPGTRIVEADTRPMQYANTYGIAKIFGEQMGRYYHERYGLDFRSVRFCSINGPGRPFIGGTSFLSKLFRDLVERRDLAIPTDETTSFLGLYVYDAVQCLMKLYDAAPDDIHTRIYNIAGIPTVMRELAAEIRSHIPDARFQYEPDSDLLRDFESWPHTVDESAARQEWGWRVDYDMTRWVADFLIAEGVMPRV